MSYDKTEASDKTLIRDQVAFTIKDNDKTKSVDFISNIVNDKTLHNIQMTILDDLTSILYRSFGPCGSNTCIKKLNAYNMYTKDGHTILSNIYYNGIIEQSIKDDIETITQEIVKTVGDGTTSAVILSDELFKYLYSFISDSNVKFTPGDVMRAMDVVGKDLDKIIRDSAKETTLDDIYDIAKVSSNGNEYVANLIKDIYKENGMSVFIDVAPITTGSDIIIKSYDGMTIDSGIMDSCFVTNTEDNSCTVENPEVYFFEDPIDTRELGILFDSILTRNICMPFKEKKFDSIIPTVIIAPKISKDMSSLIDTVISIQNQLPAGNKLPLDLVVDRVQPDQLKDIAVLCGAKMIYKYIDSKVYEEDVKNGLAPTIETVFNWAGHCDSVVSSTNTTSFINPTLMRDENGEYTIVYNNLIEFVEKEIDKNSKDGGDISQLGILKRRLHSLKSNLVEMRVGGMTVADRDALLHLIEDAVKNCRSAAANGTGWGANVSGLLAIEDYFKDKKYDDYCFEDFCIDPKALVAKSIKVAYETLVTVLYSTRFGTDSEAFMLNTITNRCPADLTSRGDYFNHIIKSSIESDTIILNSVMKIVGMMVTCNQFITPTAQHNVYSMPKKINGCC